MPRIQTLDSWKAYRNYRFLWTANFFGNTAQWLQLLTLGWLVKHLSEGGANSALLVVGVGGTAALPGIFIGPWGGVIGDRLDRRKLMIGIEIFMALLALSFALIVKMNWVEVWHAFAYAFLAGSCESIKMPVRQALIANTVHPDSLSNAYATNVLTIPGTRMIGPFVGGIIVASLGFFWNFTIEAVLYLGVAVALLPMKTPFKQAKFVPAPGVIGFFADMVDGFKYLWKKQRVLALMIGLSSAPNIVCHPVLFLLPMFTAIVLQQGPDYGGYFMAVNGAGGLAMVFLLSAFGFPKKRGMACIISALASAVLTLVLSQSIWMPIAFLVLALFGATQTMFRTTNGVLTQILTDDEYRVRVTSLYRIVMGMVIFFSLTIGWLADSASPRWALATMGVVGIIISVLFLLGSKRIREQE